LEFWFGFAIIGLGGLDSFVRVLAFFGPICLFGVMYKLTIPITERVMKPTRAEYWEEYCEKYNKLMPSRLL